MQVEPEFVGGSLQQRLIGIQVRAIKRTSLERYLLSNVQTLDPAQSFTRFFSLGTCLKHDRLRRVKLFPAAGFKNILRHVSHQVTDRAILLTGYAI